MHLKNNYLHPSHCTIELQTEKRRHLPLDTTSLLFLVCLFFPSFRPCFLSFMSTFCVFLCVFIRYFMLLSSFLSILPSFFAWYQFQDRVHVFVRHKATFTSALSPPSAGWCSCALRVCPSCARGDGAFVGLARRRRRTPLESRSRDQVDRWKVEVSDKRALEAYSYTCCAALCCVVLRQLCTHMRVLVRHKTTCTCAVSLLSASVNGQCVCVSFFSTRGPCPPPPPPPP